MRGALSLALLLPACATTSRPGEAEARFVHYADDNYLSVTTLAAKVEQPLTERSAVFARAIADHVVVTPRPLHAPHGDPNQPTGHRHDDADVVTSASSTAGGAAGSDKWRYEGTLGGQGELRSSRLRGHGRVSTEPDYLSFSGFARWTSDLADANTTLSVFAGYGHDRVTPFEAPAGQEHLWPATHQRVLLGGSIAQVLSPALLLTAGLAATAQRGTLSNPYRRAVVRTSLFPEVVPDARDRFTGLLALSWHLGWGAALHLRQGVYADSWGVRAVIPEAMLAKELGARWLLAIRYRYYAQAAADFYLARYRDLEPIMSGDPRLGTLREHAVAISARATVLARAVTTLVAYGELDVAQLEYRQISLEVRSAITTLGLMLTY